MFLQSSYDKIFLQWIHKKRNRLTAGAAQRPVMSMMIIPLPHYEYFLIFFFFFWSRKKNVLEFPSYTAEPVRTASANITARTIGTTLIMGKVSGCDILTLAVYFLYPSLFIPRLPTLWYFGRLLTHLHLEQSINVEELRFCVGVEDEGKVTEREGTAILKKKIDDEIENT